MARGDRIKGALPTRPLLPSSAAKPVAHQSPARRSSPAKSCVALLPGAGLEPSLHYWQRSAGRPGEIDYLLQTGQRIVPVELKSGAAGAMKSLHQFVHERGLKLAVRCDTNPPSLQDLAVKTTLGNPAQYRILNLPGYLLWHAAGLLAEVMSSM